MIFPLLLLAGWAGLVAGTWWWIRRAPGRGSAYDRGFEAGWKQHAAASTNCPPGTSLQWIKGWNAGVEFAQSTSKQIDKTRLDASYDNGRADEYRRWLDHPNFPDFRRRG